MELMDYIFFRIYTFYRNSKDSAPILMGVTIMSILVCSMFLAIITLVSVAIHMAITDSIRPVFFIVNVSTGLFFWNRYSKGGYVIDLEQRFKDEDIKVRRFRGWFLCIYMLLTILITISVGYIRHNLGIDI